MKVSSVTVVFAFIVLAHAALSPRELSSIIRRASQLPTLKNSFSLSEFASSCGQLNCTGDNGGDCPVFNDGEGVNCVNGMCVYYPGTSQDYCTSPDQCGTGSCLCQSTLSDGCACTTENQNLCITGNCIESVNNGTCVGTNGFINEYCDYNYPCVYGNCSSNSTCQWLLQGQTCITEMLQCAPGLSCNRSTFTCESSQPCNVTFDYECQCSCPFPSFCDRGQCFIYGITEGGTCNGENLCEIGLACINSTCQQVQLGTPCENFDDCEFVTQECNCVVPSNKYPMECADAGGLCESQAQAFGWCVYEYCSTGNNFDGVDNGSPCYEKCNPLSVEMQCCTTCLYPEWFNNTIPNYSGNCAAGTFAPVDCCNPTVPCTILSVSDMCDGYPGYIGA